MTVSKCGFLRLTLFWTWRLWQLDCSEIRVRTSIRNLQNLVTYSIQCSYLKIFHVICFDFCLTLFKPSRKPRVTAAMKYELLTTWHWAIEDWKNVTFSKESTLQQLYWKTPHDKRFDEKHTILNMNQPPRQMVWNTISKYGTAGL